MRNRRGFSSGVFAESYLPLPHKGEGLAGVAPCGFFSGRETRDHLDGEIDEGGLVEQLAAIISAVGK
jgi:hypothetical protein